MPQIAELVKESTKATLNYNEALLETEKLKNSVYLNSNNNRSISFDLILKNLNKRIFIFVENTFCELVIGDKFKNILENDYQCNRCKNKVHMITFQRKKDKKLSILKYCTNTGKLTKDHIFPKRYGGLLTKNNKQHLCYRCNSRKSDKLLETFLENPKVFIKAVIETIYYNIKKLFTNQLERL